MSKNTVTQEQIEEIIAESNVWSQTIWDKCTLVACRLPNGFIITESSACVDSDNYDEDLGVRICMERIENKVWELEGYKFQSEVSA
jgi:hypothetical protein